MAAVEETMAADAAEAMKLTRKHFVLELDFSESSIQSLQQAMEDLEFAYPGGKSTENIELFTRVWGAYLGETIRRQHGGHWSPAAGSSFPLLVIGDHELGPHDVIRRCLSDDTDASLRTFYQQACG